MRKIMLCIVCLLLIGLINEIEGKVPKNLRQPEDSNNSLLAVYLGPLKALSDGLGKKVYFSILFVKIGSPGNESKSEIIASNYSRNGRVYLINATPGKYAAVALLRRVFKSGIGIGFGSGGVSTSSSMSKSSAATFFSEEIVKESTIEVKPGEFAFIGKFQIDELPEDGYFTLNEIMNCDYNAKLVVLSACQTGTGKMERAEGVTGLTRAVMYAGTPAVVASLWKVDDTATKELMVRFYRNMLEKNMDKTEALRQAKLELLKTKTYSSPLFWSAFIMYGE